MATTATGVVVSLRRSSGEIITGVRVELSAPTCQVAPNVAIVDNTGTATFTLTNCLTAANVVTGTLLGPEYSVELGKKVLYVPPPLVPASYSLHSVSTQTAGLPISVTLTAYDTHGRVATSCGSAVHFSSTDPQATLPPDSDCMGGTVNTTVVFQKTGPQTLYATLVGNADPVAQAIFFMTPGPPTVMRLQTLADVTAGQAFALSATVVDAYGNLCDNYNDTVILTSSDPRAPSLGYIALAGGVGSDQVSLSTVSFITMFAEALVTPSLVAQSQINVSIGPAAQLVFVSQPSGANAGAPWPKQPVISIVDVCGNVVTSGPDSTVPVIVSLSSGAGTLRGNTSVSAVRGVANFNGADLNIDVQDTHDIITATAAVSSGSLRANSAPFATTLGPPVTYTWLLNNTHESQYSFDPNLIAFNSNTAELLPASVDDRATSFNAGTAVGVIWDANAAMLRLGTAGGCDATENNCSNLDASWTPQWANLLGYWPMDTVTGSTVPATVGPALSLTASADTVIGQVRNGMWANIRNGAVAQTPAGFGSTPTATCMGWFNWFGGSPNQRLMFFSNTSNRYLYLTPSDVNGVAALGVSVAGSGSEVIVRASAPLPVEAWVHVAATLDGNTAMLYINGTPVAQAQTTITLAAVTGTNYIGGAGSYSQLFNGVLDEVAVFGAALDANAIATIYTRQADLYAGTFTSRVMPGSTRGPWSALAWNTSVPFHKELPSGLISETATDYSGVQNGNLNSGLVLLWHFNETTRGSAQGNDFADDTGQGNAGVATAAVTLGAPGRFSQGLGFDGDTATMSSVTQFVNPQTFTLSLWFNTLTTQGGKMMGFGTAMSGDSGIYDRHLYMDDVGHVVFGVYPGQVVTTATPQTYNDGRWHHAAAELSNNAISLFIDGVLAAPVVTGASGQIYNGYWRVGGDSMDGWTYQPSSEYLQGRIDEVALWMRPLSNQEVYSLWRRGANRNAFQIRTCLTADCSDAPTWRGPDGTNATYFDEVNNRTLANITTSSLLTTAPDLPWTDFPALALNGNYMQYRIIMASDEQRTLCFYDDAPAACSPEVANVRLAPVGYPTVSAPIMSNLGRQIYNLASLAVSTASDGCAGGITFNLSNDGIKWFYFDGQSWQRATGSQATANTPAQLTTTALAAFTPQVGSGVLQFRAFLASDGTTPCSLAQVTVTGN